MGVADKNGLMSLERAMDGEKVEATRTKEHEKLSGELGARKAERGYVKKGYGFVER